MYEQLPLHLFVTGYWAVVDIVKSLLNEVMLKHLCELMADMATYSLELVCAYHAVWIQRLVNGWTNWNDAECKLEFPRALV